jgi:hypothetical protein
VTRYLVTLGGRTYGVEREGEAVSYAPAELGIATLPWALVSEALPDARIALHHGPWPEGTLTPGGRR